MAKSIMVQGTMSNAGKSLLVAGLCRIMRQDGYRVAPFKSQNMALNSFITREGLEMGRAQVMQAQAAGIEPSVSMNPILLKPTNETGSQIIVNGEVLGNMSAKDYFAYKKKLVPDIRKAYQTLVDQYDVIVLEGAGSPAEINLKEDDIVNMGMAKMVNAPVLLAGDIDRGGVFAQLVGTLELLEQEERDRVKGLIINKFRGDVNILQPGIAMLEAKAAKPVVGVVPYMHLDLDDEDSLSTRLLEEDGTTGTANQIDIAVIRLPRISNFTDYNILGAAKGVSLRYVEHPAALREPDLIILPGTKNTMGDLKWLRESGMEAAILKRQEKGSIIFGICGGFQMLGNCLEDPEHLEEGGMMRGIGLLAMRTVFERQKTRTRVSGKTGKLPGPLAPLSGLTVEGYEIHMGRSMPDDNETALLQAEGSTFMTEVTDAVSGEKKLDGMCRNGVYGTYLHGFFDQEQITQALLQILAEKKGIALERLGQETYLQYRERQYDLLAAQLRESLDMKKIYQMMEEQ